GTSHTLGSAGFDLRFGTGFGMQGKTGGGRFALATPRSTLPFVGSHVSCGAGRHAGDDRAVAAAAWRQDRAGSAVHFLCLAPELDAVALPGRPPFFGFRLAFPRAVSRGGQGPALGGSFDGVAARGR